MTIALPGFADPVLDSQLCFRAVLEAMARPGTLHRAGDGLTPPAPLALATAAVLLTLVDGETALWAAPDFATAREWIAFHCGAPAAACAATAGFVLTATLPDLAALDGGSDELPARSATVVLQVSALGRGRAFSLSGPGIRDSEVLRVAGLPEDFPARWAANHAAFPCGVDLILCSGNALAALPRSVCIEG